MIMLSSFQALLLTINYTEVTYYRNMLCKVIIIHIYKNSI